MLRLLFLLILFFSPLSLWAEDELPNVDLQEPVIKGDDIKHTDEYRGGRRHFKDKEEFKQLSEDQKQNIRDGLKDRFQRRQQTDENSEVRGKVKERVKDHFEGISEETKAELARYHAERKKLHDSLSKLYDSLSNDAKRELQRIRKLRSNSTDHFNREELKKARAKHLQDQRQREAE